MNPFVLKFILFLYACHHRVEIVSVPHGAEIYQKNTFIGTAPLEISHWWVPFQKDELDIHLIGYKKFPFYLRYPIHRLPLDILFFRYDIMFGFKPVRHTIILQKES